MPSRLSPALQWAFQLQSIAAVAPASDGLGASLADIGILIGLHLAPTRWPCRARPVGQRQYAAIEPLWADMGGRYAAYFICTYEI